MFVYTVEHLVTFPVQGMREKPC